VFLLKNPNGLKLNSCVDVPKVRAQPTHSHDNIIVDSLHLKHRILINLVMLFVLNVVMVLIPTMIMIMGPHQKHPELVINRIIMAKINLIDLFV
jgi:hypothetical protein